MCDRGEDWEKYLPLHQLEKGEATIVMVEEPTTSFLEGRGAKVVYSYPQAAGAYAAMGVMVTDEYARTGRATVQGVTNALQEALRILHEDPARALKLAQACTPGVERQELSRALSRLVAEGVFPASLTPTSQAWDKAMMVGMSAGRLPFTYGTSSRFFDKSFAPRARRPGVKNAGLDSPACTRKRG